MFDINKIIGNKKSKGGSKTSASIAAMFKMTNNSPDIQKIIIKPLNMFGTTPGASPAKQKQWKGFSEPKRNLMRKRYKDTDGDRIPNRWDCQPKNIMRQDTLENSEYVTLYHGTPKSNISNIMKNGLRPAVSYLQKIDDNKTPPRVSLTGSIHIANIHGEMGSENDMYLEQDRISKINGGHLPADYKNEEYEPAILKITIPKKKMQKDNFQVNSGKDVFGAYEMYHYGIVEPKNIKVMNQKEVSKRINTQERRYMQKRGNDYDVKNITPGINSIGPSLGKQQQIQDSEVVLDFLEHNGNSDKDFKKFYNMTRTQQDLAVKLSNNKEDNKNV